MTPSSKNSKMPQLSTSKRERATSNRVTTTEGYHFSLAPARSSPTCSSIVSLSISSKVICLRANADSTQVEKLLTWSLLPVRSKRSVKQSQDLYISLRHREQRGTVEEHIKFWLPRQVREDRQTVLRWPMFLTIVMPLVLPGVQSSETRLRPCHYAV